MFLAPLSVVQSYLSPETPAQRGESNNEPSGDDSEIPMEKSESPLLSTQSSNCTALLAPEDNGDVIVDSEGEGEGFMLFRPWLTNGKYLWKVIKLYTNCVPPLPELKECVEESTDGIIFYLSV